MPTIDDLKSAFEARATTAPTTADVLDRIPATSVSRPRTRRLALAVAASVTAVATVTSVGLVARGPNRPPAAQHDPGPTTTAPTVTAPTTTGPAPTTLRYSFRLGSVPGYRLRYAVIAPHVQFADVLLGAQVPKSIGGVAVYGAGAFDPTAVRTGQAVMVNGHHGYFAAIIDPGTAQKGSHGVRKPALAWEYAPDAWAVVQGDWQDYIRSGALTGTALGYERRIAVAVTTGRSTTMRLPARFTYLPKGLAVETAGVDVDPVSLAIGLTDGGRPGPQTIDGSGIGRTVTVSVVSYRLRPDLRDVDSDGNARGRGTTTENLGTPVRVAGAKQAFQDSEGTVTVLYRDRILTIGYTGPTPQRVSNSELLEIAAGVRNSAGLDEQSTWFDATTITP